MASKKLRIGVLFGGRSAEHEVSLLSATNVMAALDPGKYDAIPIFVTREGQWLLSHFKDGVLATPSDGTQLCLVPGGHGRMLAIPAKGAPHDLPAIDILFPVLHGLHGEDGAVQGLAEVARVPLTGCGILGSANALDKDIAKRLLKAAGVPVARSVTIEEGAAPSLAVLEDQLGLPIFIKPARQGSSVGVAKVNGSQEFERALGEAFQHDRKLLAEEFIRGREIEYSVLESPAGELFVSRPGEIVPAELPPEVEAAMRAMAAKAFRAVGCDAMARVDFFLMPDMTFVINELNTIPGFTDISMYAKAMAASGVSYPEVIDRLVAHGLARAKRT